MTRRAHNPKDPVRLTDPVRPFLRYFADLWGGVATTCIGMAVTLRYLASKPVTMRYPEERPAIPPGHRGLHAYEEAKCILCRLCANACPVGCITIESAGKGKDGLVTRYDVDYSRCLFCNLCAEACPTHCLWLSEQYSLIRGTRGECALRLARPKTATEIEARRAGEERKAGEARRAGEARKAGEERAERKSQLTDPVRQQETPKTP